MNKSFYSIEKTEYELIAQDPSAQQKLFSDIDNLLRSRCRALATKCDSNERASYIVESLITYGRYVSARNLVAVIQEYPDRYSINDIANGIASFTHIVDMLLAEIDTLVADSDRFACIQEALFADKPSLEQRNKYITLSERRAYARALVAKLQSELAEGNFMPDKDKNLLLAKLNTFAVLNSHPNVPADEGQAVELESALNILEPILDRVQLLVKQYKKRLSSSELYTDITPVSKNNLNIKLTVTATDRKLDVPPHHATTADSGSYSDIRASADRQKDSNTLDRELKLGNYQIQRGDTLADILSGDTAAGYFPIIYEITPAQKQQVIKLARKYFANYPDLCTYVGSPDSIDRMASSGISVEISLDALHDVVSYIAHEHGFIKLPPEMVYKFREILRSQGEESIYRKTNFKTDDWEIKVVAELYNGDKELFDQEWWSWLNDMLPKQIEPSHTLAILGITFAHWRILHADSTKRYQWLRTEEMPLRVWNEWSDVIRRLITRLPTEEKKRLENYTIADIAKWTYVYLLRQHSL